ncbi:MAG: patatin-like phospholipase family protein [Candidatus Omnitrophica bacterium]|nr:patatin-like phospholipase family protein [Candidatus Omnitrophota bacterium]
MDGKRDHQMTALPSFFNKLAVIKQTPIFEGLNWFELNRIARRVELVEFNKGDVICRQGDPADAFYALISGRVYSYTLNSAGQKEEVDFILRGMHFGIISTLTGENHSHTYEAINDSAVIKIKKDDFAHLLKVTPKLAVALSQSLSHRIRSHVTGARDTQESTIIAVYASVKGSGSSTYAANLALTLKAQTDKKVLLLRLSSDLGDSLVNLADIVYDHDKIIESIIKNKLPIDVLGVKFDAADHAVLDRISPFVSAPVNDYSYIVFDLPNQMDDVVMKTLVQSDLIHLVTVEREYDLELTRHVIDRLSEQLKDRFQTEKVQIIISGVQDDSGLKPDEIKKILNYDVFLRLPHLKPQEFQNENVYDGFFMVKVDPASEYAFFLKRLSRQISGSLIGLVLGGGAALGMAHIGVLRVLEQEGIPIDIVVGSSMGALMASLWASGYTADDIEKFGREFGKKTSVWKLFDLNWHLFSGPVGGEAIKRWLRTKIGDKTFHDAKILLKITAYDLYHRQEIIIDQGPLVEAVRKSVAIPGVIKPVMYKDQMIIDGGVLNPLPTNVLVHMGIKKIIAVNVLQSPADVFYGAELEKERLHQQYHVPFTKHPFQYVKFRFIRFWASVFTPNVADIIVRTLQATEYVLAEQSSKQADVIIHPDLKGINWFELYEVNQLIKRGQEATLKHLPSIKALVKR